MTAINRLINILTSALMPLRLYVGGSGAGGPILSGLSNLDRIGDVQINWDDFLLPVHDLNTPYGNANYSSDARQSSSSTKPKTSKVIDTTKYDARINDLRKQIDDIGYIGPTKAWDKGFWGRVSEEEAAKNRRKQAQVDELYKQIADVSEDQYKYLLDATAGLGYTDLDKGTTQASQALLGQQQSEAATAQANKTANINAGINKSRAGMLGSQKASTDNSVAQNQYMANRSTAASTQADYLEKMAQANALDQQASNMNKSAELAALSGTFTGAGSGAALGATISDENMKEEPTEDPIDNNKLQKAIAEFKRLSDRLKQLKGEK